MTLASPERARTIAALPTALDRAKARAYWSDIDGRVTETLREIDARHAYRRAVLDAADLKRWRGA